MYYIIFLSKSMSNYSHLYFQGEVPKKVLLILYGAFIKWKLMDICFKFIIWSKYILDDYKSCNNGSTEADTVQNNSERKELVCKEAVHTGPIFGQIIFFLY